MIDVIKTTNPFGKTDECLKITNNQSNELAYNFGDILEESKSYTFSCWFKADTNLNINIYISDKQSPGYAISTKWTKIVFTATADISKSKKVLFSVPVNKTLYAYEGMLELGNLPSDFKPNDKDVDNKVVTLQTNFEIQQGQINSLIKETTIVDDYGKSTSLKDKYFETVATVDGMKISIGDILTSQDSMSSKITALELSADGLTSSVERAQKTGDSAQTLAKQMADKFEWIVKSGNSSTDFLLTDRTAQLVADSINLKGLVKFKGLDIATQDLINSKANQSVIDNWAKDAIVSGETTINGGYIKTNTIKTDQLAVEEIFATGSAVMNIVNAQEINANRITSGLLSAERIDAYGLSIVNKNTNQQTFNISNTGEVTIRGSVSSSNYRSKKSGWAINNDGTAEFNNITARGSVITTDGGIASSGGTGRNLARDTSDKYSAWFKPRNGAYGETMKFGRIIPVFQDADNKFVVSFDLEYTQFTKANDKFVLQLFMLDQNDSANQIMNLKGSVTDKTLTLNSTTNTIYEKTVFVQHDTNKVKVLDLTTDSQVGSKEKHFSVLVQLSRDVIEYELVACCNYSNGNGQVRIKQLKVEAGDFETDWSLAPEDKTKQVRFWAGATYEDRESAPFIVYNDGSIRATQGEYSGLWTGDIRIGNISIVDPSSQAGNDAILTIQNGDNGVRKVQLTDGVASMFAQDLIVANNTYSSMITLKQDGSAYFSKGLNIADKMTLNSDGLILDNKTLTTTSDGSGFLFNNDLHVGSAKSAAHLTVHGDVSADNVKIDDTLYFGNIIKFTKNANGINIDFI